MKFACLALFTFSATNFAFAQIPQPTDAPKARTPEQSAAAFKLPDGFRMEVIARNPDAATPSLEAATGDRRAWSVSKPHPWRQKRANDPAYFKYYNSRYGAAESEADGWFPAACGPMIYEDRALPGLHGQYFVCEPSGNLIHRALIEADGSALLLRRAPGEEKSEFAATSDQWSHPMNLTHGPDGSIWITAYYREIIEDYSAIPRHLQQQYGAYAVHDRGRIYRLTHRDAPKPPAADMSGLDAKSLAAECASPLFWRRQTAQRLLTQRRTSLGSNEAASAKPNKARHSEDRAAPALRALLIDKLAEPSTVITALRTQDALGALNPKDVLPFLRHADAAVPVHALQLSDHWFASEEGRELLEATFAAAKAEQNPRVLIQFALSLGETRDTRAFTALARLAREQPDVHWMDAAVLSELAGHGTEMLAELLREPGNSAKFLPPLAQAIAAQRDETELARTLKLLTYTKPETQSAVLDALAKGRKNAPHKPLADKSARATLAEFSTNSVVAVSQSARALAVTFVATVMDDESSSVTSNTTEQVSDETFRFNKTHYQCQIYNSNFVYIPT